MSSIALIETQYLPPIAFFALAQRMDELCLEANENYQKGHYRNRTYIGGPNGIQLLTVPLTKGKNQQLNIREVEINYDQHWQSQHWGAIRSAYGRAPYFEDYEPYLAPIFKKKPNYLFDWNLSLIEELMSLLQINTSLSLSDSYEKDLASGIEDFRQKISPKQKISESFPAFNQETYQQVFIERTGFLANLSILDLLFCTGPEASLILDKSIIN